MFNNRTSPTSGTSPNNPLNDSNKRYSQKYNRFDYGRKVFNTLRYADITPFEAVHGVEGDKLSFSNTHRIRSYTLSSPFMSSIYLRKSYFYVDMRTILPINWDKFYKKPNVGDDVIAEEVGTYCLGFCSYFSEIAERIVARTSLITTPNRLKWLNILYHYVLLFESVYSQGSLLASLGCHLSPSAKWILNNNTYNIDERLEQLYYELTVMPFVYKINDSFYISAEAQSSYPTGSSHQVVPFRIILDLMRHHSDFQVLLPYGATEISDNIWNYVLETLVTKFFDAYSFANNSSQGINLDVLFAYQMSCAQFYTNPNVDSIYTAPIYRDNQKSLFYKVFNGLAITQDMTFSYNGINYDYDICSGFMIGWMLGRTPDTLYNNSTAEDVSLINNYFGFLSNIFSYQRSLRYGDYFTGAKTRPLAVGDVSTQVIDGKVNAIDLTRNLMLQRFLNSVGRIRNTMSDYLRDIMDGTLSPRDDEPRYLTTVTSRVSGFEVENTSENQGDIVTVLKSGNSDYVYSVDVGSPCIIIGLASFEVPRVYSRTIDRFFFHIDRYDMFNKFMQYIGDQDIKKGEINAKYIANITPYAYTLRHMEYKQRFPIASGGFVNDLKSWLMVTDNEDSSIGDLLVIENPNLSSEYIRSKNYEMDRFYKSLNGYGLCSYFHFILEFDNHVDASRQMAYAPSIL